MRPDPGRELLEELVGKLDPGSRAMIGQELRGRALLLVWEQADRAGPMSEVERAMFILKRLYPEMPAAHRDSLRRQMEADWAAGTWSGFRRPVRRVGGPPTM